MKLDISEVVADFPDTRVALVVARGLANAEARSDGLAEAIAAIEAEVVARIGAGRPADLPEVQDWRQVFRGFGVKKTSYRSSVEALLRRIHGGDGLPRVNSLVDAYNAVSARFAMPVGADDLARVTGTLAFRRARPGDSFIRLGATDEDPPKAGEVVYADAAHVLCRRWNWSQDGRSAIGPETTDAVLTVQRQAHGRSVEEAAQTLGTWISTQAGGRAGWGVATAARPIVELNL